jgi:DNA-directed RNA polymerase specialized sigma24 family protein
MTPESTDRPRDPCPGRDRLSERQRVAVTLRYIEDLPYARISQATGWPENTCKTLVRRGIERLGVLVSDEPEGKGDS